MNSFARMLPALLRQAEDSPEAKEYAVFAAWNAAAGEGVRRASEPTRLFTRRLLVATVDDTWKTQLERLAPQLIFKINSMLGVPLVSQIVFRVDPATVAAAHPSRETPVSARDQAACAADLAKVAADIPDPDLRQAFLRAAGKCLARQKQRT